MKGGAARNLRWIPPGVVIGPALALTVGFAFASGRPTPGPADGVRWTAMEAMHVSPAMQRMHSQMPEELRAQCEAMQRQMTDMMGNGMMGGGMMGGGAARGQGSEDTEHEDNYYQKNSDLFETTDDGELEYDPITGLVVPPPVIGE